MSTWIWVAKLLLSSNPRGSDGNHLPSAYVPGMAYLNLADMLAQENHVMAGRLLWASLDAPISLHS
jgi:hypothetical protein